MKLRALVCPLCKMVKIPTVDLFLVEKNSVDLYN
jgi:hypothetical protein